MDLDPDADKFIETLLKSKYSYTRPYKALVNAQFMYFSTNYYLYAWDKEDVYTGFTKMKLGTWKADEDTARKLDEYKIKEVSLGAYVGRKAWEWIVKKRKK